MWKYMLCFKNHFGNINLEFNISDALRDLIPNG